MDEQIALSYAIVFGIMLLGVALGAATISGSRRPTHRIMVPHSRMARLVEQT